MKYFRTFFLQYVGRLFVVVFLLLPIFFYLPVRQVYADTSSFTKQISYQGKLTDSSGVTVADGNYNMQFKLYNTLTGGSAIWTGTLIQDDRIAVSGGLFSVLLGATSTALTGVDFNQPLYLSINVGGTTNTVSPTWDGEMTPRKTLGTVPHAFNADKIDNLDSYQLVRTDATSTIATSSAQTLLTLNQLGAGNILSVQGSNTAFLTVTNGGSLGLGTTTPSSLFSFAGTSGLFASTTATSTFQGGGINLITAGGNTGCFAVNGTCISGGGSGTVSSGTQGQIPFYNADGTTLTATSTIFLAQSGYIGIGTTTPQYSLDIATTTRTSNFIAQNITLSSSYGSIIQAIVGSSTGYTNFSGGIGTNNYQRLTQIGNLVNIGSVQMGETLLTGGGTFDGHVTYGVGSTPYGVVADDLDGDSSIDLAIVNSSSVGANGLSVLINNSDGTFATAVNYTTGNAPRSVTSADLNGDGKKDLIVANSNSSTVSVFINNGSGTFASQVTHGVGSGVYDVTAGDLNGDGKVDLVAVNDTDNNVSVLLNIGNGKFATAVNYTTGSGPFTAAIGDLNGDGRADLAVANSMSDSVSVLMNLGNGTFAARVDYAAGSITKYVAIGDVDGDNILDLVASNSSSNTVSVYINNGNGTFAAQVTYGTGSLPSGFSLNDLNGDGLADLAVANSGSAGPNGLSILINDGDGTFATAVNYTTGNSPFFLDANDFNGDGKMDVAVANSADNNVSVLLNHILPIFYAQASSGNVGIGTSTPITDRGSLFAKLTVWGANTSATSYAMNVVNSASTTLFAITNAGKVGVATSSPASTFTVVGSACISQGPGLASATCNTTAGTITATVFNTAAADVAEMYKVNDTSIEAGDIVSLNRSESLTVDRADDQNSVFGVISTEPGVMLGSIYAPSEASTTRPVALVGRIPVKVNLEGGEIKIGDNITLSSEPGIGMKASPSSDIVGIALQPFDGSISQSGKILVYVNLSYRRISDTTSNDLTDIRQIIGDSGKWSLDESGRLTVDTLEVRGNVKIGSPERKSGITLYDDITGEPYCLRVSGGAMVNILGECDERLPSVDDTEAPVITLIDDATSTIPVAPVE